MDRAQEEWVSELTVLWGKAQPALYSYVAGCVHNFSDVDDIVQDIAVSVSKHFESFDRSRSFLPWVLVIARNKIIDYQRKRRNEVHLFEPELLELFEPIYVDMDRESSAFLDALYECVRGLMPKGRKLLELRYMRDKTPSQIAEETGVSRNAVNITICRIRKVLRECIKTKMVTEMS